MVAHVEFMNRIRVLFLGVDEPKCSRTAKETRFVEVVTSRSWRGLADVKRGEFKGYKIKGSEFAFFSRDGRKM